MAALTIPQNLVADIASAGDEGRAAWLAVLQGTITTLSDCWSLIAVPGGRGAGVRA